MPNPFLASLSPGLITWIILYISDYALTTICARLWRVRANQIIVVEGSYELTPYYQRDIDALRWFSPRFLVALVWGLFPPVLAWAFATSLSRPEIYEFVLGAYILLELAVHMRHFRNLHLYWAVNHTDEVRGRVEYSRSLVYRISSYDSLRFAGLFLFLFVFTQNWFFLGGVATCLSTALKHRRLAKKLPASLPAAAQPSEQSN